MTLRLLPWAVLAGIVAALAFLTPPLEVGLPSAASRDGAGKGLSALEIRMEPVDLREYHDSGWNQLVASEAVYSYTGKTVAGTDVSISFGAEEHLEKIGHSVLRASKAFWDFEGKRIDLPAGGVADSAGGWSARLEPAVLDLETRVLRVPGRVSLVGPGVSIVGGNLRWDWLSGKITLDSPTSRFLPSALPVKRG